MGRTGCKAQVPACAGRVTMFHVYTGDQVSFSPLLSCVLSASAAHLAAHKWLPFPRNKRPAILQEVSAVEAARFKNVEQTISLWILCLAIFYQPRPRPR